MTFDPAAFENLEALRAAENKEADRAQIDAKLAEEGLDLDGAKDLMYGDLTPRTPEEIEAAKIAEANEPDAEEQLLSQLDGVETGDEVSPNPGEDTLLSAEEIKSNSEEQKAVQEGIFSPRIDSLVSQGILGNITPEEVGILKTTLLSGVISDIDKIPDSEVADGNKQLVIEHLRDSEKPENQIKYSKIFMEDFGSELSDFQNAKGEFRTPMDATAFDMISARYITSQEGEVSPEEKKLALNTAFETALNTELDGKQVRETESFKQICKKIRDDSLPINVKFSAFKDLLSLTSLEQGKGGKRQETLYRKRVAEQKLVNLGRWEKFNQLLEVFKNAEENSSQALKVAGELEELRIESNISSGDASLLAGGGDLEIAGDNTSENPTESA